MCSPVATAVCRVASTSVGQLTLKCPLHPPLPASALGAVVQALTSGAVETRGTRVSTVGGDSLRAVVASRAGEARGLASHIVVGASRARLGEAGAPGAEVASGTGSPLLQVA